MKDVNSIADPLRRLCKNGVPWQWTKVEETAFQVYEVLQQGLAYGTDIGRESGGARRCPVPIQPEGPHAETHSVHLLPTPNRGGTPIQPGGEEGTRCRLAM